MGKVKITMTVDKTVVEAFRSYCKGNGAKLSTTFELLVRKFLEGK